MTAKLVRQLRGIADFWRTRQEPGTGPVILMEAADEIERLQRLEQAAMDASTKRVAELETLLKRAHHPTCSMNCPSHVEISEGYGHCDLCRKITEALKGPSDDQRRA